MKGDVSMGVLGRWLILTFCIAVTSYLVKGFYVESLASALAAGAILGLLNILFKPILLLLTLPINLLTLGFFTLIINAFLLKMVSGVVPGFEVKGFWPALLGGFIISILNWILRSILEKDGRGV